MSTTLLATVKAVYAGGFLTVQLPRKTTSDALSCSRALTGAAVGDQVLVTVEGARMWVTTLLGAAPPPPPPPPPEPPDDPPEDPRPPEEKPTVKGSSTCTPDWTGSYRGGSWRSDTSDMYQGDYSGRGNNQGAAFFGRKPSSLGALTSGYVKMKRLGGGVFAGVVPTMRLLASRSRPSGYPSVLRTAAGPTLSVNETDTWNLPGSWLGDLESGAAGGIGIGVGGSSPYIHLSRTFTMTLKWERTP